MAKTRALLFASHSLSLIYASLLLNTLHLLSPRHSRESANQLTDLAQPKMDPRFRGKDE